MAQEQLKLPLEMPVVKVDYSDLKITVTYGFLQRLENTIKELQAKNKRLEDQINSYEEL